jgi:DivIVA domain-containing protein
MANSETSDPGDARFLRDASASERLHAVSFPIVMRGYDRRAVDDFLAELRDLVADLEAGQTREGVVQKALDEIGEETAGILQRAHETADEIAARSRTQADSRLQRAQREADIARRDADEYSEQVVADTRALWEDRQRLIEEIRQLADEVLATADDAMERVSMPEPLARHEEPTTSEDEMAGPIGLAPAAEVDDRAATQIFEFDPSDEPDDVESFTPADQDDDEPVGDGESGGTVELEALPGGEPDDEDDEPELPPGRPFA